MQTTTAASPNGAKSHPAPATIKARVRPGNRYGSAIAGSVVDVTPAELKNAKHALVSLEDEAAADVAAKVPVEPKVDAAFDAQRRMAQAGREALKASLGERKRAEMEPMLAVLREEMRSLIRSELAAALSAPAPKK